MKENNAVYLHYYNTNIVFFLTDNEWVSNWSDFQGLVMSYNDNGDSESGKVIRIVSLGEDGQFLSMDGSQPIQMLNQDDLGIGSSESSLGMQGVCGQFDIGVSMCRFLCLCEDDW